MGQSMERLGPDQQDMLGSCCDSEGKYLEWEKTLDSRVLVRHIVSTNDRIQQVC